MAAATKKPRANDGTKAAESRTSPQTPQAKPKPPAKRFRAPLERHEDYEAYGIRVPGAM